MPTPSTITDVFLFVTEVLTIGLLLLALTAPGMACAQSPSLAGDWTTLSDTTGKPAGRVRIEERDGRFVGTVLGVLSSTDPAPNCDRCQGELRGRPVVGMTILRGLRWRGDAFEDGTILDPDNGETYRCSATLRDGGRRLELRGYIGLPLFGRTQTWIRDN